MNGELELKRTLLHPLTPSPQPLTPTPNSETMQQDIRNYYELLGVTRDALRR